MSTARTPKRVTPILQFAIAVTAIALLWLVVLPKLGQSTPMRGMIERNEAALIDPSAMFYTDIEHLRFKDGMLRRKSPAG